MAAGTRSWEWGRAVPLSQKHQEYWRRKLNITGVLLAVWFAVTYVAAFFARDLNDFVILGFPLGFYVGAQGALIVYVVIIWYYAHYMDRLDKKYGVQEQNDG